MLLKNAPRKRLIFGRFEETMGLASVTFSKLAALIAAFSINPRNLASMCPRTLVSTPVDRVVSPFA